MNQIIKVGSGIKITQKVPSKPILVIDTTMLAGEIFYGCKQIEVMMIRFLKKQKMNSDNLIIYKKNFNLMKKQSKLGESPKCRLIFQNHNP